MTDVVRWGQSAYETDADMAMERGGCEARGLTWRLETDRARPPSLRGTRMLVVTSKVRVTDEVAAGLPGGCVLTTTSGYDHIDVAACRARGVAVGRCPEARRDSVVEHALGGILAMSRRFADLDAAATRGVWARGELPALASPGLRRRPVAVVGLGVIGRRMVEVLNALGAEVLGVDPVVRECPGAEVTSLTAALSRASAVTLHASLTESSRGMLDAGALGLLPEGAILVNTARGELLDVHAAVGAVRAGRLGGLVVDVFPQEPWPHLEASDHPRIVFTPHSAGYTDDLGTRVARSVVAAVDAWIDAGAVPYPVA